MVQWDRRKSPSRLRKTRNRVLPQSIERSTPTNLRMPVVLETHGCSNRADDLLDVVGCYLPKKSLENEVATETKTNKDPKYLIEVRIRLLKTLASHNTASHCK
jgi:hypothetical protein